MKVTFEEELARNGSIVYTCRGTSMYPLIRQGRDVVVIEKPQGRLQPYDVPLYKRGDAYVLHRILKVRERDYVIRGDNCLQKEYGVTDADIIGVLTKLVRNGKEIPVTARGYRLYSRLWVALFPLRWCYASARALASRLRKLL